MHVNYTPVAVLEFLRALYPVDASLTIEPYHYTTTFTALAAGASTTATLNINGNADFLALALSHRGSVAGAAQTVSSMNAPMARLLITDNGTGRQFSNAALDLQTWSENGAVPKSFPFPRMISGKSSLSLLLTSYAASETPAIDVVLHGVNVYTMSR